MIANFLGKITIWLGAYQKQSDGLWYFLDGTPISSDSNDVWQTGYPNTSSAVPQRCVGIRIGYNDTGAMNFNCETNNLFACLILDPAAKGINNA